MNYIYRVLTPAAIFLIALSAGCRGGESGKALQDADVSINGTADADTLPPVGLNGNPIRPYEEKDTIIYGPSGDDSWIPLNKLPIRDYSFERILREFGKENLGTKEDGDFYDVYSFIKTYSDSVPKILYDRCMQYRNLEIPYFDYTFRYPDGTRDYLLLQVFREGDRLKILWGYRVPSNYRWPE